MGKGYPSESTQMIETLCKYEGKKRQTTANVGERGTVKRGGTEEMVERGSGREKRYHLEFLSPVEETSLFSWQIFLAIK